MKSLLAALTSGLLLTLANVAAAADTGVALDLKQAVPTDVHLAVYLKHNPERDYQTEYFKEAWETFRDEKICERVFDIITSRAPKDKLEEVQDRWNDVKEALEPINGEALLESEECVFAQKLEGPVNQFLMVVRLSDEDAADYQKGIGQLFELVQKWSDDKVKAGSSDADEVEITTLDLPHDVPIKPAVAHLGDLFVLSTSAELVKQAVDQLQDESAESKFDDARLKEAQEHLPEAEDCLAFLDGKQLFKGLHTIPEFIREKVQGDDEAKEKAERVAGALDDVLSECDIFDYVVTVEYTEDGQNRNSQLGKMAEGYDGKLLGKALSQGEAFEDWQKWIPADATSFSLSTGVNLHVLYEGTMAFVKDKFPEANDALAKFDEAQDEVDVHLDEDVLKSFSGESVSITMPAQGSGSMAKVDNVYASKCQDPDKIRDLLNRGIEGLNKIPQMQAQGLKLKDCEDLEGFQEIQALSLQMAGAKPVIGFKDDWMIIASSTGAVQKFLDVRAGDADSIADSDKYEKFNLKADGDVYAASYSDVGAGVRQTADTIDQMSNMLPMYLMMAMQDAKPEDQKTLQDALGLLPSFAKVIRKFDYFEDKLSVTHEGPLPDSFLRETVTNIRQPDEK